MPRTPPVREAASTVDIDPQRRKLHPSGSPEVLRDATSAAPPRAAVVRAFATFGRSALPLHRDPRVTAEARWYPTGLAAGSTAARPADPPPAGDRRTQEATASGVGPADRLCAVLTMLVAASLAVVVSVLVAPQLRAVSPPTYPETSSLMVQGAAAYAAHCAGCHGADLKGGAAEAPGVTPPPLEASGHAWLHSDATLFRMVKYGIANCLGDTAAPRMPRFAEQLDDRSIQAVLAFVESRWPAGVRIVQSAFNDGLSDAAETQEAVLCTAICAPPAPSEAPAAHPHVAAR